jgi:hypothetical protein
MMYLQCNFKHDLASTFLVAILIYFFVFCFWKQIEQNSIARKYDTNPARWPSRERRYPPLPPHPIPRDRNWSETFWFTFEWSLQLSSAGTHYRERPKLSQNAPGRLWMTTTVSLTMLLTENVVNFWSSRQAFHDFYMSQSQRHYYIRYCM